MKFAVRVCEQVKSNAIVMVQGTATVGIGPGQTSRVEAVSYTHLTLPTILLV